MDYASIHVILLDERIQQDRFESGTSHLSSEPKELLNDVQCLLSVFKGGRHLLFLDITCSILPSLMNDLKLMFIVYLLGTGSACLAKTRVLDSLSSSCNPVFVFLPVTQDLRSGAPASSTRSSYLIGATSGSPSKVSLEEIVRTSGDEDIRGFSLLRHIMLEIEEAHFSKLVVPIAIVDTESVLPSGEVNGLRPSNSVHPGHVIRCIELGAADVISSPLDSYRLHAMSTLAYRAHIEGTKARPAFLDLKKSRKLSWVGVDEQKPYAYLREVM